MMSIIQSTVSSGNMLTLGRKIILYCSIQILVVCSGGSASSSHEIDLAVAAPSASLLVQVPDVKWNLSHELDLKVLRVLNRDGPDFRSSRDVRDFSDISLDTAKRAWQLMHNQIAGAVRHRIDLAHKHWIGLAKDANVTSSCLSAIVSVISSAQNMDDWAIKLLNAWGRFPMSGLYDSTYSEPGSYDSCVRINNVSSIGHAHYCSITFRPIMPSRPDFEVFIKPPPKELTDLFANTTRNRTHHDFLYQLSRHSHYVHLLYYKVGTCWPIQCSPFDVRKVAKLVAKRLVLTSGPTKCFSLDPTDYEEPGAIVVHSESGDPRTNLSFVQEKLHVTTWDDHRGIFAYKPIFTRAHWIASSILLLLFALVISITLVDVICNKLPALARKVLASLLSPDSSRNINEINHQVRMINKQGMGEQQITLGSLDGGGGGQGQYELVVGFEEDVVSSGRAAAGCLRNASYVTTSQRATDTAPPPGYHPTGQAKVGKAKSQPQKASSFLIFIEQFSIPSSLARLVDVRQNKSDIQCLNGIRSITMVWIIQCHVLLFNDWSGFSRVRGIEFPILSFAMQPLFNGGYLVDSFFLMSGLVTAYATLRSCAGDRAKFSSTAFLVGRWLRLTPQMFIVSLIFIILPTLHHGPHWYPLAGEYSENCIENWWVNLLQIHSFYRQEKMCNFVTWWISIDFSYHLVALFLVWIVLAGSIHLVSLATIGVFISALIYEAFRHYTTKLPPALLSSLPLTGVMWKVFELDFFWKPYAHAVPYFMGFYIGYLFAMKPQILPRLLTPRTVVIGWTVSVSCLILQTYSAYWFVLGLKVPQILKTTYYITCPIIWASALSWIIIACHLGHGGFVNRLLTMKPFILLSRASYSIYLSHFHTMYLFFGSQTQLLDSQPFTMSFMVLGNIVIAIIHGTLLCVLFELPWLRIQRLLMRHL